jgi:hypothetical protein
MYSAPSTNTSVGEMLRAVTTVLLAVLFGTFVVVAAAAAPPDLLVAQGDEVVIPSNPPPEAAPAEKPAVADPTTLVESLEGRQISTGLSEAPTGWITFKTPFEQIIVAMTVGTLAVTLLALIVMGWGAGLTPEFTRAFIVVVIVFAALFLIAAGYSDKQAAPVYALLGTIVGYIFGKLDKQDEPKPKKNGGDDEEAEAAK